MKRFVASVIFATNTLSTVSAHSQDLNLRENLNDTIRCLYLPVQYHPFLDVPNPRVGSSRVNWFSSQSLNESQEIFFRKVQKELGDRWGMMVFSGFRQPTRTTPLQFGIWAVPTTGDVSDGELPKITASENVFFPISRGNTPDEARAAAFERLKSSSKPAFVIPRIENGRIIESLPVVALGTIRTEVKTMSGLADDNRMSGLETTSHLPRLIEWPNTDKKDVVTLRQIMTSSDFVSVAQQESDIFAVGALRRVLAESITLFPARKQARVLELETSYSQMLKKLVKIPTTIKTGADWDLAGQMHAANLSAIRATEVKAENALMAHETMVLEGIHILNTERVLRDTDAASKYHLLEKLFSCRPALKDFLDPVALENVVTQIKSLDAEVLKYSNAVRAIKRNFTAKEN